MVSVAQRIRYLTPPGGFKYWLPSQSSSLILSFDASSSFIMYVKVLTTFQHRLVAEAVHDYWTVSRATICSRSVQVISQFQAGHTDDFRAYVDKLVRPIIFCPFSSFNFLVLVWSARYLRVHQRVWLAPCDYRCRFIFNPGMCSVSYQPSWIIRFLDRRYRLRSWHDGCPSARLVSIRTVVSRGLRDCNFWRWQWGQSYYYKRRWRDSGRPKHIRLNTSHGLHKLSCALTSRILL